MKEGCKVKYIGCSKTQINWGSNDNPSKAGIVIGKTYIVSNVEVHTWHTKISLEGIEGRFNSVCFEVMGYNDEGIKWKDCGFHPKTYLHGSTIIKKLECRIMLCTNTNHNRPYHECLQDSCPIIKNESKIAELERQVSCLK